MRSTKRRNLGGRPPLPEGEARTKRVAVFLRPGDLATLEGIAAQRGVPTGQVARELLERALARRR